MTSKIIFLNPPIEFPKPQISYPNCVFLNAIFNASALKRKGFKVKFIDSFLFPNPVREYKNFWRFGSGEKKIINEINSKPWDFLVVSYAFFNEIIPFRKTPTYKILSQIKKNRQQKIILADCHLSSDIYIKYDPIRKLKEQPKIDFVCTRESEQKILSVLEGKPIAGVAYKKKGKYFFEESQGENQPLTLDFDLINVKGYLKFLSFLPKRLYFDPKENYFPLLSSRGCNFNCVFCTQEKPRGWQGSPLKDIENWIRKLKKEGVKKIAFLDLVPNFKPARFEKILDILIKENLKATFPNGMRGDFLTEEIIKKAAKCMDELTISIESGEDRIREGIIQKRLSLGKIIDALKIAQTQGLEVYSNFIIGLPGETKREINSTLKFAWGIFKKFGVVPKIEYLVPIAGAPIWDKFRMKKRFHPKFFREEPYFSSKNWQKEDLKNFLKNFEKKLDFERSPTFVINLNKPHSFNEIKAKIREMAEKGKELREKLGGKEQRILKLRIKEGEQPNFSDVYEAIKWAEGQKFEEINLIIEDENLFKNATFLEDKDKITFTVFLKNWRNEKILGELVKLNKKGKKISVNILLNERNYRDIRKIVNILYRLKIKKVNIFFFARPRKIILAEIRKLLDTFKEVKVFNLPYCQLPGYEKFLNNFNPMINSQFNQEIVNILRKLSKHKNKKCNECVYDIICSGNFK